MFLFIVNSVCDEPNVQYDHTGAVNLPAGIVSPAASQLQPLSEKSIRVAGFTEPHKRVTSTAVLCSPTLSLFHYSHHLVSLSCYSSVIQLRLNQQFHIPRKQHTVH